MRFKTVVLRKETEINTELNLLKREIENNSLAAEQIVKVIEHLIELSSINVELLEKEYEQELV